MPERLYKIEEAAAYFKVTRQTIYEWMKQGRLKWVLVGGRRRITESAMKEFIGDPTRSGSENEETGQNINSPSYALPLNPVGA